MSLDKLQELLNNTKVEDCAPKSQNVVVLESTETVPNALKKLIESDIISAPVIDSKNNKFMGLIDVLDILSFVVELFGDQEKKGNIFKRISTSNKFSKQEILELTDSIRHPFIPLSKGSSLLEAVKLFTEKKCHRIPIVTKEGKLISILTMSAVVNFLAKNIDVLGDLGKKTVQELKIGTQPVLTVSKHMRTIDALKTMHQNHISGLGVVDDHKKLIGNISARDLKSVNPGNIYQSMCISSGSFVQQIQQSTVEEKSPVIACRMETSFAYVVGRLAANRIHRLYVTDKEFKAIAVISLRDVLSCIMKHLSEKKQE